MFSIASLADFDRLSREVTWQHFEKLVAFVCEQHEFEARQNVVMKTPSGRRQYDVIATRFGTTLLIECKKWRGRKEMRAAIAAAAAKHAERAAAYAVTTGSPAQPIIVTLLDDGLREENGMAIVPIAKLNEFLSGM